MQTKDKRNKVTKTQQLYLAQESKRNFRGWSKEGLEFLGKTYELSKSLEEKRCQSLAKSRSSRCSSCS